MTECVEGTDGAANGSGWQTETHHFKISETFSFACKTNKGTANASSHEGFVGVKFAKDNSIIILPFI